MTKLRAIIIGFGRISAGLTADEKMARYFDHASHASALTAHPAFEWLGVVDPSAQAQREASDRWNIPHVGGDVREIASLVQPDVAIIATPPGGRADILRQLSGVKAVLVEKPLNSPGDKDGDDLLAVCGKAGVDAVVNYWRRADRLFQSLANGDLTKEVGDVQAITAFYGNGLANNASHMIDLIRMLGCEVTAVQATGEIQNAAASPVSNDMTIAFSLVLENGAVAAFHPLDFDAYREVGLDIWGTQGRLSILQEGLVTRLYSRMPNRGVDHSWEIDSDSGRVLECTVSDSLTRMYDNLAAVALGDAESWSTLRSALVTEQVLALVRRSAENGGIRLALD